MKSHGPFWRMEKVSHWCRFKPLHGVPGWCVGGPPGLRGGTPGRDDFMQEIPPVVITELLAHTDLPLMDAIELFNPLDQPVDVVVGM